MYAYVLGICLLAVAAEPLSSPDEVSSQSQVTVSINLTWFLEFFPDGRVHLQFGSTAGDGASLPKGTVKYDAILQAVQRLRTEKKEGVTQVAIRQNNSSRAVSFAVSDDTLFRYLIESFEEQWRPDKGDRLHELLKSHPIYPDESIAE